MVQPSAEHGISGGSISLNLVDPKSFGKFAQDETYDFEVSGGIQSDEVKTEPNQEEPESTQQAEDLDQESKDFRATLKTLEAR